MYLSLYCKGSKRGYSGFACERDLERPNRNFNILTSTLMTVSAVSFLFSWCSDGAPGSTLLGASFLYCILLASSLDPNSSGPQAPSAWCGFTNHNSSISVSNSNSTGWLLSWLGSIIVQRLLDRPLDLWNRMFNRHQAEITVMQFRSHSLPVRRSMRVSWDFLARPISSVNFCPRDFLS